MTFRTLHLGLPRPQYLPSVELILSDLIWQALQMDANIWPDSTTGVGSGSTDHRNVGLVYESLATNQPKNVKIVASRPQVAQVAEAWSRQLPDSGFKVFSQLEAEILGESVLDALRAPKAEDAKSRLAVPLTPAIALLQNNRGISRAASPVNWAFVIEMMYRLGATTSHSGSSVTRRLWTAMDELSRQDSLLRATDQFIQRSLLPIQVLDRLKELNSAPDEHLQVDPRLVGVVPVLPSFTQTPFFWFHNNWNALTSSAWVGALSSRRWLAWATTVLRAGIGFGYLWEARWYEVLSREVIDLNANPNREPKSIEQLLRDTMKSPLTVWLPTGSSVSDRDVSSRLLKLVQRGHGLEAGFRRFFDDTEKSDPDLLNQSATTGLRILSENKQLISAIESVWSGAKAGESGGAWEAIKYVLLSRKSSSGQVRDDYNQQRDFYGFLSQHRKSKYLFVEPSTEWIAVIASLVRNDPATIVTLKPVREAMNCLGLQPSVDVLTACLEAAGLARSAPDADTGVKVASAFGAQ